MSARSPCSPLSASMGSREANPVARTVYLDKLSFAATWGLFRQTGIKSINILDAISTRQSVFRWLFLAKGVQIVETSFFSGDLRTPDGEALRRAGVRMAGSISLAAARRIVESDPELRRLNETYQRNTLRLFIAKELYFHAFYWIFRMLAAQALCNDSRAEVWLRKPERFDYKYLEEAVPAMKLRFYPTGRSGFVGLVTSWLVDIIRHGKLTLGPARRDRQIPTTDPREPSVLILQEDTLRFDRSLRGQPHWLNGENAAELFKTYIVELPVATFPHSADLDRLSQAGVTVLPSSVFGLALRAKRKDEALSGVRRDRRSAIRAAFRARGFINKFFLLRAAFLLRQAELMGALALWLNAKVFLVRETYYSFADAMQLVAPRLGLTTIAYQYSNLGFVAPPMMSTADTLLIFSEMYKAVYRVDGVSPKEFLATGYLYDGVASLVRDKAHQHRAALTRAGAQFIVCYFDESVQHDRWGLVSEDHHLSELHALAHAVLTDPTFGVLVKSQFMRYSPSQLYPGDVLLQRAKATGRYLELMEGVHRNDIYPTEAALVADLCIGHKFGATAALEAAIAGVRTVLLDSYGTKTLWDDVYARADIVRESITALMEAIVRHRAGEPADRVLGDWKPILHYFDPYRDGKAMDRLRGVVAQRMANLSKAG